MCVFAGKGIPNVLARSNDRTTKLRPGDIPSTDEAVHRFHAMGGHLTTFSSFGSDPLVDHPDLVAQRDMEYARWAPEFPTIFHAIVNGNELLFKNSIVKFIELTNQLTP